MNKKDLLYNNYKKEKIYKYELDNNYYKSYGNISKDRISLGLSSSQLKDLRTVVSLLSDKQYKLLSDVITNAKNLGINVTYSDILFLAKEILSSDKLGYNSSKPVAQTPKETEEEVPVPATDLSSNMLIMGGITLLIGGIACAKKTIKEC